MKLLPMTPSWSILAKFPQKIPTKRVNGSSSSTQITIVTALTINASKITAFALSREEAVILVAYVRVAKTTNQSR